jgi:hypothetical protein
MLNFQFLSKCGASPLIITYYITSLFGAITLATELGIVLQQISNPLHLEPPAFRFSMCATSGYQEPRIPGTLNLQPNLQRE